MEDFSKYLQAATDDTAGENVKISEVEKVTENIKRIDEKGKLKTEIPDLEWKITKCQKEIESGNIRSSLITSHYKKTLELLPQIDEIGKRISSKSENHRKLCSGTSSKTTFYATDMLIDIGNNQTPGLESPCMRCVRETCELISSFFNKEHSKNVGIDEIQTETATEISKDELWNKTENIAHSFSPSEVFEAFLSNVQSSSQSLTELASRIDLKKDAHSLKFKFETGKLKDISSAPAPLQTVKELIEQEGQVSHFKKFLASEKANNEAWQMKKRLEDLNNEIDNTLREKCDNKEAASLRKFLSLRQWESSSLAALSYLNNELLKLKREKTEKEEAMSALYKKYNRIQNFDQTVQAKQTMIRNLIQTNGLAKSRHRQQHQDILTSTEQKIVRVQEELTELCNRYKELSTQEVSHFMKVPVQNIYTSTATVSDEKRLVSDMTIHRLNPAFNQPGEAVLHKILETFDLPSYTSSENLLPSIAEMKKNAYSGRKDLHSGSCDVETWSTCSSIMSDVTQKLTKYEQEELQSSLPKINESSRKSSSITAECLKFRNASEIWWNQPAQTVVPWVKEDGLNLQQYLDQFSSHASTLKKMQLVN